MMIKLKPAKTGLLVHLEDGSGYLPPNGSEVTLTAYWRRRIQDGDVIEIKLSKKEEDKNGG